MKNLQTINHSWIKNCLVIFSFFIFSSASIAASNYDKWAVNNPDGKHVINHQPMSSIYKFLTTEGDKSGKLAYYRSQGQVLDYITKYRQYLEKIPVSILNKNEQLAYWLNLHNVVVIEMLSNNIKLTKKVKKLRGTPGNPKKQWTEKRVTIEQTPLSLEEIEQQILIAHWQDPLVIYGLLYGTKGSPIIGLTAFTGATVHEQLTEIAGKFISNTKQVKIKKDKVTLSSLYIWNKESLFANDDAKLIAHLQKYAKGNALKKLKKVTIVDDSHHFNWSTNAQRKPRRIINAGSAGGGGFGGGS